MRFSAEKTYCWLLTSLFFCFHFHFPLGKLQTVCGYALHFSREASPKSPQQHLVLFAKFAKDITLELME